MITFIGIAKDAGLDFGSDFNAVRFRNYLREHQGKTFRITEVIPTRSINQNRLYWLYLEEIERETGNSANDLHELFRRTLLTPKFITVLGKEIKIPRSTTELTKTTFAEYMEKICAETGVEIPDAETYKEVRDAAPLLSK